MTEAFFVPTALADGPRHGYGIVSEIAELSPGRVRLKIAGHGQFQVLLPSRKRPLQLQRTPAPTG